MRPLLVVILGPTASGKTSVALQLAKAFDTSIISADSRQVYKELPIGSAQPSDEELKTVSHYLISSHTINDPLDAASYAREARRLIEKE
ncbi:MAG TPA: isopentenyl transferase family protein, partial [Bacteroidia bacterium]|nr:isopentenyl transferase family protein [Bacteroidia bacterium]